MLPIIILTIENSDDRDLMTQFYLDNKVRLYCEAKKYLNISEDVEDIVYEAIVKIIEKMDVFRELAPSQRVQYALVTVKNLSYIFSTRQKLYTFVEFDDAVLSIPVNEESSPETIVKKMLMQEQMEKIWKNIDLEDKRLLEQKYILRWSDEEIAAQLGIQPQSVRMRLTRARRKVAEKIGNCKFFFID